MLISIVGVVAVATLFKEMCHVLLSRFCHGSKPARSMLPRLGKASGQRPQFVAFFGNKLYLPGLSAL